MSDNCPEGLDFQSQQCLQKVCDPYSKKCDWNKDLCGSMLLDKLKNLCVCIQNVYPSNRTSDERQIYDNMCPQTGMGFLKESYSPNCGLFAILIIVLIVLYKLSGYGR